MSDSIRSGKGGYRYTLSDEVLLNYMTWSIADRLNWLEQANLFLAAALEPKAREIRDAFRKG